MIYLMHLNHRNVRGNGKDLSLVAKDLVYSRDFNDKTVFIMSNLNMSLFIINHDGVCGNRDFRGS